MHGDHDSLVPPDSPSRIKRLWVASRANGLIGAAQLAVGAISGSTALMADGAHNFGGDFFGFEFKRRAAKGELTRRQYRFRRVGAAVSVMLASAGIMGWSAHELSKERSEPDVVDDVVPLGVAALALAVNSGLLVFEKRDPHKGSALSRDIIFHAATDVGGSAAAAVGVLMGGEADAWAALAAGGAAIAAQGAIVVRAVRGEPLEEDSQL